MSWHPTEDPECPTETESPVIVTVIEPRNRDIGGFGVRRVLPARTRRRVGPFVFFDEMGPAELPPGQGIDILPHPHIGLATITYLFEGEIVHRDSLGVEQTITPGDVNWMVAGRGVVHSERTGPQRRRSGGPLHGIQAWVALPREREEVEPSFEHHGRETLPAFEDGDVQLRVIAGSYAGHTSPVRTFAPMFYVDAQVPAEGKLTIPEGYEERAVHVVEGSVEIDGRRYPKGDMLVLTRGFRVGVRAIEDARLMLLGGAPLDGDQFIWWNFVSSDRDRLERAKQAWRERRFPSIPGDDETFAPLPGAR